MSARMSEKQARAAGILPPKCKPKGRPEPRNGASSRCKCGETFTSDAAETGHVAAGHNRFESVNA